MTANFYGALCAWCVCFLVTASVSAVTAKKPSAELSALVYRSGREGRAVSESSAKRARIFAGLIVLGLVVLNWLFR